MTLAPERLYLSKCQPPKLKDSNTKHPEPLLVNHNNTSPSRWYRNYGMRSLLESGKHYFLFKLRPGSLKKLAIYSGKAWEFTFSYSAQV
jgi:hypothetical protein